MFCSELIKHLAFRKVTIYKGMANNYIKIQTMFEVKLDTVMKTDVLFSIRHIPL